MQKDTKHFAILTEISEGLRRDLHWSMARAARESSMSPNTYQAIKGGIIAM